LFWFSAITPLVRSCYNRTARYEIYRRSIGYSRRKPMLCDMMQGCVRSAAATTTSTSSSDAAGRRGADIRITEFSTQLSLSWHDDAGGIICVFVGQQSGCKLNAICCSRFTVMSLSNLALREDVDSVFSVHRTVSTKSTQAHLYSDFLYGAL